MVTLGLREDKEEYSADDVPDLNGKIALITGATNGVGLEVAKVLASKGARVLALARKEDDPHGALEQIRQYCADRGVCDPDLESIECDLANLEEVRRVGDEICEQENRLDILICDAGVGIKAFDSSPDGIDLHFAVNHLGHFLLINRLLPLLWRTASAPASSAPWIVCVTSTLHTAAPWSTNFISHAELTSESYAAASPLALYARAKLAAILFVKFGLAPRLSPPPPSPSSNSNRPRGILALAADPGPVHPGQPAQLGQAYGAGLGTAAQLAAAPLERTPADAAQSTLWAATAPGLEDEWERWQGAYVAAPGREGGEGTLARDVERGARLWAMSEDLVRKRLGVDALRPWTWNTCSQAYTAR